MARHEELKLRNLHLLDGGRPAAAFEYALEQAVSDCQHRPHEQKVREVVFKFRVVPSKTEEGAVNTQCVITTKIPSLQTKVYEMRPHHNGKLSFNPDDPDNDTTLFDEQERREDGLPD